jgi:hypothetical protein
MNAQPRYIAFQAPPTSIEAGASRLRLGIAKASGPYFCAPHGRPVIIQDWDFKNRAFMERMHVALCSGARTIALLSPDYLARDHCAAEWQHTIADDPLNRASRLIVLRIRPCIPVGLLKSLAYWDLVPVLATLPESGGMLRDVVLAAVRLGRQKDLPPDLSTLFSKAQPVLHPEIRPTPNFTAALVPTNITKFSVPRIVRRITVWSA